MNVIEKIATELKLERYYVSRIAERSYYYYRNYTIPKRNGEPRFISQPSPELKTLQYWISHNILMQLPVSSAAYAYKKGDSIKRHAQLHRRSRFFLHADIHNFFPSIRSSRLNEILVGHKDIFDALGLDLEESIADIGKICFKNDCLCIGAVSSPVISNVVMYTFDEAMLAYCKERGYLYSRYADDIYISSKSYLPADVLQYVQQEITNYGFVMNHHKTRFSSPGTRRKVTGLVITNDARVSVGTERRKSIRKSIYEKLVHGRGDPDQILGYLSFLKDVEPDTYDKLIEKFSKYCTGDLLQELRK